MVKPRRFALRMSTRAYLVVLLLGVCAAFSGLLYYFFQSRLDDAQRESLAQTKFFADVSARAVDIYHSSALSHAKSMTERAVAQNAFGGAPCPEWLSSEAQARNYANIFIFAPDGRVLCSARVAESARPPPAGLTTGTTAAGGGSVGSFYKDGTVWSFPLYFMAAGSDGKTLGTVVISVRADKVDLLRDVLLNRGVEISYIDLDRTMSLTRPADGSSPQDALTPAVIRSGLARGLNYQSAALADHTFAASTKTYLSGWAVVARVRSSDVYAPLLDDIALQTGYLGLLCLLALLGIWAIAMRLSAATRVLVKAAGNMESLFTTRSTGISEIDTGLDQLRRSSIDQAKAQAAVELWRSAAQRTRSGMAILRKNISKNNQPMLVIEVCNPAFELLSGMRECVGLNALTDSPAMGVLADAATVAEMRTCAARGGSAERDCRGLDGDGFPRHVLMSLEPITMEYPNAERHFCLTLEDVTQISEREAQLERQSTTDALTGLPNRSLFTNLLSKSLALSDRHGSLSAVVLFNVDHFKFINDSIGHDQGDKVIATIAERLASRLRPGDTLSRFGGDEFGAIFADVESQESLASLIEAAREALDEPVIMSGHSFQLTFSSGAAVYPEDGQDPKALMSAADIAMFQAKELGRGNVQFHSKIMSASFAERLSIEQALKIALQDGSIEFLYQPKISLATGQPCGMEALARWMHPVLGEISPSKFIPLAEASELIAELGDLAIRCALRDAKFLWDQGFRNMPVAINVSARQVKIGFVKKLAQALAASGLPSSALHVEITESSVMPNSDATREFLAELARLNIKVALDDFGTGWSNMAMLKTLPLSYLKMDRSFVIGLGKDEKDAAIAKAVVSLARALGVEVIAEGVETAMQAQQLIYLQADQLQGYYVCKPLTIQALSAWLHSGYIFQGVKASLLPAPSDLGPVQG